MAAIARQTIAFLLAVEALNSMLWAARIVSVAPVYDVLVLALVALRVAVSALQAVAAWQLGSGAASGPVFARLALAFSAGLTVAELGFRLAPSSVLPTLRYPVVVGYCFYALTAIGVLRWTERRANV